MTCLFASRHHLLFLCALLVGSLAGCSRQRDGTTPADNPGVTPSKDESGQIADKEIPVAKQPKRGFHEYVKDPDLFRKEVGEKENADTAPPLTERELAHLVSAMRTRRLEYEEIQKLDKAGDKVVPLLQEALCDEKFLLHRYGKSVLDGSPMETALEILEKFRLPEARVLEPALRHPDEFFRYHALYYLARCGNYDAIVALKVGLNSESEQCRSWTLMGLGFLKDSPRGSKKFRTALFEAAVPLLEDKEHGPAEQAPRALLALNFEQAKRVLLGRDIFRPDNESINKVLKALIDANVPVPGPQLRSLLAGIKNKATGYPFDYAYADGLILLARVEGSNARDLIVDGQSWGNAQVKDGAARASEIVAGVTDAYGFVIDLFKRKGARGLTEPQLHYLTLCWLDAEVSNGGFSQFYFNSSGELAPYAVRAASAVGAPELAGIIQKANAMFGEKGPDPDRNKRMDQLSKVDLKALGELDTQYYRCSERLSEILPRFVAANSEAFKPAK